MTPCSRPLVIRDKSNDNFNLLITNVCLKPQKSNIHVILIMFMHKKRIYFLFLIGQQNCYLHP